MTDLYVRLRSLMMDVFQVGDDEISPQTVQHDLENWDSVEHLNFMLALEDEFGVKLDVDDLSTLTSVAAIVAFLERSCVSK